MSSESVYIMGNGGWGTALAVVAAQNGHAVTVWGHNPDTTRNIAAKRENQTYLPGVTLPESINWVSGPPSFESATVLILAMPSRFFRTVLESCPPPPPARPPLVASVSKGLDPETRLRMSEVAREILGIPCGVISGPTHAEEVAQGAPSAITASHEDENAARRLQHLFTNTTFRVYTSTDVKGVELGGILKNVMAIAAGVGDGIGFGDNSKAALLTRGLAEMRRLGTALGAEPDTFYGLSGMGDLIVTCTSQHSRNRGFGERIGGLAATESIPDLIASMDKVVEGYWNAQTARELAREHGVETPIIDEVCEILFAGKNPRQAVLDLLSRETRSE